MSLTSYRAAPPRGGVVSSAPAQAAAGVGAGGWKTWRRPTLPRLEAQYHGRWGFSRPSSGWDRVQAPRHGHQVIQPPARPRAGPCGCVGALAGAGSGRALAGDGCAARPSLVRCGASPLHGTGPAWIAAAHDALARPGLRPCGRFGTRWCDRADRAIRTGQLSASRRLHTRPIDVVVFHGPQGDLVSRWVSRLDAFSGYPVRT